LLGDGVYHGGSAGRDTEAATRWWEGLREKAGARDTKWVHVRLDRETGAALEALVREWGCSRSAAVRGAVRWVARLEPLRREMEVLARAVGVPPAPAPPSSGLPAVSGRDGEVVLRVLAAWGDGASGAGGGAG
jgi:hypothetical protein